MLRFFKKYIKIQKHIVALIILTATLPLNALTLEPIPFADFSSWKTRGITESKLIGGKHKTIYEIAPEGNIEGNIP